MSAYGISEPTVEELQRVIARTNEAYRELEMTVTILRDERTELLAILVEQGHDGLPRHPACATCARIARVLGHEVTDR